MLQGEKPYFWWESCGYCGLLVDELGKGGKELLLFQRGVARKCWAACLLVQLKIFFTTEAQRHGGSKNKTLGERRKRKSKAVANSIYNAEAHSHGDKQTQKPISAYRLSID
jgi:hypothetical protein